MRILITSGLNKQEVGGPARYGPGLKSAFIADDHDAKLICYGKEKKLPIGIRHLIFFIKILPSVFWAERIIVLDTFSVGLPTVLAARICNKKSIVRVGGDFLWESYVERTGEKITLSEFNKHHSKLNVKEKLIHFFTRLLLKHSDIIAFNTEWQQRIWSHDYHIPKYKTAVIWNYMPEKRNAGITNGKLLWAGRKIKLKNISFLEKLSKSFPIEVISNIPHVELQVKIKNCHALILPSFSEVCPNFILEGISYGKPFIMTNESGFAEICKGGGLFVPPYIEDDWVNACQQIFDNNVYTKLCQEIRECYKPRPWKVVSREYLNV